MPDIFATWSDPHARHAMLVHFPIVLGLLGVVPLLGLAFYKFNCRSMACACILWFVLASIGAGLAAGAGEEAEHSAEEVMPPLTSVEEAALHEHEELGEGGWRWPLIPAVLAAFTLIPRRPVRIAAGIAAIVASLGVALWVANTAHHGGKLVYTYGVGVPSRSASLSSDQPPAPQDAGSPPPAHEEADHRED